MGRASEGILTGQHHIDGLQPRPHAQQLDEQPDDEIIRKPAIK